MSASEMTPKGQPHRWSKRCWRMILLLALMLLLANAAFYVFRPKSSEWDASVEMTAPTPGRVYVSALTKLTPSTGAVFAIDSEGADWQKVIDSTVMYPRVSPDGKLLAYAQGDTISVRDMNLKKSWKIADFHGRPSWSPDGQWLVISEGKLHEGKEWKTQTWRIKADGSEKTRLTVPDTEFVSDWSSDGKWFVTWAHIPSKNHWEISIMPADGNHCTPLTKGRGSKSDPRFAPGTNEIVYTLLYAHAHSLWIMNRDGSNARKVIEEQPPKIALSACWSPDGKRLVTVFQHAETPGQTRVEIMDKDGGNRRELPLPKAMNMSPPDWR